MIEEARLRNEMGDHVEVLDREQVQARIHSPLYEGALFDHDGNALVDPARLVWGLERACLSLGVTIFENSKVDWLEDVEDGVRVHAPYGAVTAAKVALATNVFPSLIRQARKYVVAVYDYALVTEPLSDEQLESIGWTGREGVADSGNQFHYYRLTKDNSILWGGYDTIYNFRGKVQRNFEFNAETYAKLASHFLKTFPQLAGIKFTHAWGGAIDTCTRFSPFWGTAHRGKAAYVMGYTGLGVASTRFGASVDARPLRRPRHRANAAHHGSKEARAVSARAVSLALHPRDAVVVASAPTTTKAGETSGYDSSTLFNLGFDS